MASTAGVVVGAVTVNQGREMRSAKQLIAKAIRPSPSILQNPLQDLRTLLA